MTNTNRLLDKARALCSPPTDYRLAKTLGIATATIARCRTHGATLDNKGVRELARFLEQDFETVLAMVELDRAKTPSARAYWERVAPRILPLLLLVVLVGAAPEVRATPLPVGVQPTQVLEHVIHYAKLIAWLLRRGIGRSFNLLARKLRASYQPCHAAC